MRTSVEGLAGCLALLATALAGCEGDRNRGAGPNSDDGGTADVPPPVTVDGAADTDTPDVTPDPQACSDLFKQDVLATYLVEISSEEWDKMMVELQEGPGEVAKPYHPCVFHYGDEVVSDARIRLRGQSSWLDTLANDANPKGQFLIAFDQVNTKGRFHGLKKLVFDMPQSDATMLRERLSWAALSDMQVPAMCANSARLVINGTYYGLYTAMEKIGGSALKRLFPEAPDGPLYKGGDALDANEQNADLARFEAFWAVDDAASMAKMIDIDASLEEWAGEVLINDGDGYYGGHNFYTYDHPTRGFLWLATDLDATFSWRPADQHPLFWWRNIWWGPRQHWVVVLADDQLTQRFVGKIAQAFSRYDAAKMESRLDTWSAQIATAAAEDPHRRYPMDAHRWELTRMRASFGERVTYLRDWLACELDGKGADEDGDGLRWCMDCDDKSASVRGIYENCF